MGSNMQWFDIDGEKISFELDNYQYGGRLAIQAYYIEHEEYSDGEVEDCVYPYSSVTVNLPDTYTLYDEATFVDDNNSQKLADWLIDNGYLECDGNIGYSGYCSYREVLPTEKLFHINDPSYQESQDKENAFEEIPFYENEPSDEQLEP